MREDLSFLLDQDPIGRKAKMLPKHEALVLVHELKCHGSNIVCMF